MAESSSASVCDAGSSPLLPRITISYCTQCKWMLRAAYFAQELLSTFSTSLGEVALQPATGGTFVVSITTATADTRRTVVLWDRKADGGFPETKELKRRVRDVIEPGRDLGHVDRDHGQQKRQQVGGQDQARRQGSEAVEPSSEAVGPSTGVQGKDRCEDCA